ncbi:HD domain-containing protein [Tundrisphaera lichenicola]|uniref:HD domain-containing protein n=1 Tax=Tundrisphaera lichenicola TaxID=2029860 RepID=UPI003EB8CAE1
MRWNDRVYGEVSIDDPGILALIECPTFQRLRGIRQAGPSALAFPFKTVTRYEHSLGVHLLLGRLGADRREQVAGLLHDVSHTAFSHAVDFVFASEEQDHHEGLKPEFLHRPDLVRVLARMGYEPEVFYDDSVYPLLEQPLPGLCADRLDYFCRDSLACGVTTPAQVSRFLSSLIVVGTSIAFRDQTIAREAADCFAEMNRDWWASPTEAYIYNEFADSLREAFRLKVLRREDLLGDDAEVLQKLQRSSDPRIAEKLDHVLRFDPLSIKGFVPRVEPKVRWLDPLIYDTRGLGRLSEREGPAQAGGIAVRS